MTSNTIHTKFNGTYQNDNIPVLGKVRLTAGTYYLVNNDAFTIKAIVGTFSCAGQSGRTTYDVAANQLVIIQIAGNSVAEVVKYGYTRIDIQYAGNFDAAELLSYNFDLVQFLEQDNNKVDFETSLFTNLSSLKYVQLINVQNLKGDISNIYKQNLETVRFHDCDGLTGNINSFGECASLTSFKTHSCANIQGDIASLGKCIALTELQLTWGNFTGTIESFVRTQVSNGRTTCSGINLYIYGTPTNITFDGDVVNTNNSYMVLSWEPSGTSGYTSVTFNGKTIDIN